MQSTVDGTVATSAQTSQVNFSSEIATTLLQCSSTAGAVFLLSLSLFLCKFSFMSIWMNVCVYVSITCMVSEEIKQNWWYSTNADAATIVAAITDPKWCCDVVCVCMRERKREAADAREIERSGAIQIIIYQRIMLLVDALFLIFFMLPLACALGSVLTRKFDSKFDSLFWHFVRGSLTFVYRSVEFKICYLCVCVCARIPIWELRWKIGRFVCIHHIRICYNNWKSISYAMSWAHAGGINCMQLVISRQNTDVNDESSAKMLSDRFHATTSLPVELDICILSRMRRK